MEQSCKPLTWPEKSASRGPVRRFFEGFPWVTQVARTRRDLRRQLNRRSPSEVLEAWGEDPDTIKCLAYVASVIDKWMEWGSILFIPSDPCEILFWDTTTELRAEGAMQEIEKGFSLPPECLYDTPPEITLGEFV